MERPVGERATLIGHHGGNPYHDPTNGRFTNAPASETRSKSILAARIRSRVAQIAASNVGAKTWEFEAEATVPGSWEVFRSGTYKCNLFVYYVLNLAGANPGLPNGRLNWLGKGSPPSPDQWANLKYHIPGWHVLGPRDDPRPGDVVAQRIGYSDADGHVMIVGKGVDGRPTFIGTGGSHEDIVEFPLRMTLSRGGVKTGPLVFRRWVGR